MSTVKDALDLYKRQTGQREMNTPTNCPHCGAAISTTMPHRYDCDTHFTGFRGRHCWQIVEDQLRAELDAARAHAAAEKQNKETAIVMLNERGNLLHGLRAEVEELKQCLTDITPTLSGEQGCWTVEWIREWVFDRFREQRELRAELERLQENVCDECDGDGWCYNRVEGRHPCVCMTEAEPYQILQKELAALRSELFECREALAEVRVWKDCANNLGAELSKTRDELAEMTRQRDNAIHNTVNLLRDTEVTPTTL